MRRYEDKSVEQLEAMRESYFMALKADLTDPTACMVIRAIADIDNELDLKKREGNQDGTN